jgi:L-rhamnose mutarotase
MRRFGQVARLKAECVEEYKRLHEAAWPDVLKMISQCNLRNYSIYLMGRDLFAYFEYNGDDFEGDMERMAADPVTQDWWTHTKPCFENHEKQVYYEDMKEIFHWD